MKEYKINKTVQVTTFQDLKDLGKDRLDYNNFKIIMSDSHCLIITPSKTLTMSINDILVVDNGDVNTYNKEEYFTQNKIK